MENLVLILFGEILSYWVMFQHHGGNDPLVLTEHEINSVDIWQTYDSLKLNFPISFNIFLRKQTMVGKRPH